LIGTIIIAIAAGFDRGPVWCGYVLGAGMILIGLLSWAFSIVVASKTSGESLSKMLQVLRK